MRFEPALTAVVGATGPTGIHLTRELVRRGRRVRVVARREERLRRVFEDLRVEIATADAIDADSLRRAVAGCELIVDCVGLPPERMADHPRVAAGVAAAARVERSRCLQISSYWSFLPHRGEVVDESHPRRGGHRWFRWRRQAEEILLAAGAAVAHLPDFFGPQVHTSAVQRALEEAVSGGPIRVIGAAETGREAAYVPEIMRLVADLAERPEAYGTDWAMPGHGILSAAHLARIASDHLGRSIEVRGVPAWVIRPLSLLVPALRPVAPLAPHYARPVRYETTKLAGLLGEARLSPLDDALRRTLDWIVDRAP